jgi:flagellar protein FlgJ
MSIGDLLGAQEAYQSRLNPVHALKPAGKPATPEQKKLWKACQDFESVMLGMVFKQMRESVGSADPLNQGQAAKTYREMLDDETAKNMAKSGGMGLADGIYRQLQNTVE